MSKHDPFHCVVCGLPLPHLPRAEAIEKGAKRIRKLLLRNHMDLGLAQCGTIHLYINTPGLLTQTGPCSIGSRSGRPLVSRCPFYVYYYSGWQKILVW